MVEPAAAAPKPHIVTGDGLECRKNRRMRATDGDAAPHRAGVVGSWRAVGQCSAVNASPSLLEEQVLPTLSHITSWLLAGAAIHPLRHTGEHRNVHKRSSMTRPSFGSEDGGRVPIRTDVMTLACSSAACKRLRRVATLVRSMRYCGSAGACLRRADLIKFIRSVNWLDRPKFFLS